MTQQTSEETPRPEAPTNGAPQEPATQEAATQDGQAQRERVETRGRPATASLVRDLVDESSALMHAEIALARSEMQESLTTMQRGAMAMGAGGIVLFVGTLALTAAAILALSLVWPAWLAALVVGGAVALIGAILLGMGRRKVKPDELKPDRTMHSLRETQRFARNEGQHAMRKWR